MNRSRLVRTGLGRIVAAAAALSIGVCDWAGAEPPALVPAPAAPKPPAPPAVPEPLYRSSVVATDFDFITDADPSVFEKLDYIGEQRREMADKRPNAPGLHKQAYVFAASFTDGTRVTIVIDAAFASVDAARAEAMRYVHPLGKLPTLLRGGLHNSLVVHQGGEDTTAFSDSGLIIVYAGNATKRISTHDLEETMFHESIHASLDGAHADSPGWLAAQAMDRAFITNYARKSPQGEDLAESALFAYTLLHHPERIPPEDATKIRALIPNRIAYIAEIFPPGKPIFTTFVPPARPAAPESSPQAGDERAKPDKCRGDISKRGILADVLSNALRSDYGPTTLKDATAILDNSTYRDGEALFQAVVAKLKLDPEKLKASILRHQHTNCTHGPVDAEATKKMLAGWKATP